MVVCDYGTEVERWKVRLIVSRARRFGFAEHELPDVQQEVIQEVMSFEFDEARSNGATEVTALTAVIDHALKALRRSRARYEKRLGQLKLALGVDDDEPQRARPIHFPEDSASLVLDVRHALADLSPEEQSLCTALAGGSTIREIATRRGCSWCKVKRQVTRVRQRFEELGLDGWLEHGE